MSAVESEAVSASAGQSDYPIPPDLCIPRWISLIGTAEAVKPHLFANMDSPAQASSATTGHPNDHRGPSQDFYRKATWAPDGSSILAITESQQKHILVCSRQSISTAHVSGSVKRLTATKSPSPLLDAVWYPVPAIAQPVTEDATPTSTWCFAESHRDLPTRLTASDGGQVRASYSIMNHVEKFVGPHSLAFSPDMSRLYCGLWSALAAFPLSQPGLNTHSHIPLVPSKTLIRRTTRHRLCACVNTTS